MGIRQLVIDGTSAPGGAHPMGLLAFQGREMGCCQAQSWVPSVV